MQGDACAALLTLDVLDREFSLSIGLPAHCLIGTRPASIDCDLVGNDERGIEADTELPDQLCVVLLIAGHLFKEFGRARTGDRTQVVDQFLARHADAVIRDGQQAVFLVDVDTDRQLVFTEQFRLRERLEAELVRRI